MNRVLDRMGWYEMQHWIKHWIVWFLLVVIVGTIVEAIPWDYEFQLPHTISLALSTYLTARLIVGKKKE